VLGLAVYVHHLRAGVAAMVAAMDGLDAIVFSGGVGEHAADVRAGAADGLGFLGVGIDHERNRDGRGDRDVTAAGRPVRTLVIAAAEDLEIARQVQQCLT
jgi:acetate kinase